MDAHEIVAVEGRLAAAGRPYEEFIRSHDLSVGLYRLPVGGIDPQSPHTEDEVYHVIAGRATLVVGDERRAVGPGSVVFIAADVVHRFVDITQDLTVLVVFGPAEYTHRVDHEKGHPHGVRPPG